LQAVAMVKKTPAYKNRLRALELERSGGVTNKKKSNKQMDKYEIILIFYEIHLTDGCESVH
jgi:DnaJ family protein C protein 25